MFWTTTVSSTLAINSLILSIDQVDLSPLVALSSITDCAFCIVLLILFSKVVLRSTNAPAPTTVLGVVLLSTASKVFLTASLPSFASKAPFNP